MRVTIRRLVGVCKRKGAKVNAEWGKMLLLEMMEGSVYELCVDGKKLGHTPKFKYFGLVLGESATDRAEC